MFGCADPYDAAKQTVINYHKYKEGTSRTKNHMEFYKIVRKIWKWETELKLRKILKILHIISKSNSSSMFAIDRSTERRSDTNTHTDANSDNSIKIVSRSLLIIIIKFVSFSYIFCCLWRLLPFNLVIPYFGTYELRLECRINSGSVYMRLCVKMIIIKSNKQQSKCVSNTLVVFVSLWFECFYSLFILFWWNRRPDLVTQ